MKALKSFTLEGIRSIIEKGESPENLDNLDNVNRTHTTVQMTREMMTSNGCHITLIFPAKSRPGVRREIIEVLVAAMEKGIKET